MSFPDWRKLKLRRGILAEPIPESNRLVLWLSAAPGKSIVWERVSTLAGSKITENEGIFSVAASSIQATKRGFLGRIWQKTRPRSATQLWILPNGQSADQVGTRRSDLLLVWPEEEATLDEARLRSRWPQYEEVQKIADNLFLVRGVLQSSSEGQEKSTGLLPGVEPSIQVAEQRLAAARYEHDRRRELAALTDLGVVLTGQGNAQRAVGLLEEARALARQLGDPGAESDVLDNLGLALLNAGRAQDALEPLGQALETARVASCRFAEKVALTHIGMAYLVTREFDQALSYLKEALMLARQVSDRQHEAELLWQFGMVHAEAGDRESSNH
jgi:tetratricopeptide (TPR) repeat protein